MNRLLHYFYDKKAFYILYLSCIGIFCLILYLYNVFIEAVIYATILCLVLLIVYFAIDYFFYYQKTNNLESIFQLEDMILLDLPQIISVIMLAATFDKVIPHFLKPVPTNICGIIEE